MAIEKVIKRDGTIEAFMPEKLNQWGEWAVGESTANWSDLVMRAIKGISDTVVDSDELTEVLIRTAIDMIQENPDYDIPAKELMIAQMRKRLFDSYYPPSLRAYHDWMVTLGQWSDKSEWVSDEQFEALNEVIDHSRDHLFTSGGLKQFLDKYSRRSTITGQTYETPQFMYMGMVLEMLQLPQYSVKDGIDLYNELSLHRINVPTPPLVGLRSGDNGFASCCLVDAGDTLGSIGAAAEVVYTMTAARAGIGYHLESRSIANPVRNGAFSHSGKIPYYKHIDRAVKANQQQSRGGSATVHYNFFDPEILELMQVKSQRTPEENKIDKMDYSLKYSNLLLKRYLQKKNITLFSILDAPEVWEAFHSGDEELFDRLYEEAENRLQDSTVVGFRGQRLSRVKSIPAATLLDQWATIRLETGRVYAMNVMEANRNSPYKDPIRMSNLCQEILQPTTPYESVADLFKTETTGEVSLCNLGGLVLGNISNWEHTAYVLLKFVDSIIDIQYYPYPSLEYTAKARRNVGIGLMNAAGAMAKEGLAFEGVEARNWIHREAEKAQYFLYKASVSLARELGKCDWFDRTQASENILCIDTYKKSVDTLVTVDLEQDWNSLREDIKKYGMRNSVLTACMPGESSSVLLGVTNSVEPPRQPVTIKSSAQGAVVTVVPGLSDWDTGLSYKYAFSIDREEHIKWLAVLQKFVQQTISTNLYYDFNQYEGGIIPNAAVIKDLILLSKYGVKNLYYANFLIESESANGVGCSSGGCTL
ncbi:putative ribonucleoside-diphosphate reductase alpha subunit [Pectobacterium phage DU_PP_V]|uniref:Putative ribonucleoside-diphosphate reductase alpha subunit n=1 Tax=Pectobacterium phage DU_PP_V TaxID=2041492 RepID=A0A2D2W6Y7_9CAUD|nr:NrdA-like aerobic NDP reductase large subunit [Pectobacterium phage DU_PP_V]ATS94059.1 putative ribonucleoside-diphosphate reductase alpha subunit [Pectobacterium phage DU_PP_V]